MQPVDPDYTTKVLEELVRINSINPCLVPGAPGEGEIAGYVAGRLRELQLEVARYESHRGRPSVVGLLRGSGDGRSLMLNAHLDTVGIGGMSAPFEPRIEDGRLHGRGAYDMKGSLAACLSAVKALQDSGCRLSGDLIVAAVADEEHASLGTAEVISHHPVDGAIVTEPTQLQICRAHKGFVWSAVHTRGRAAHGSNFSAGVDANLHMGRVLNALAALERELRGRPPHPLVGPPSLHAATLEGGSGLSTYADRCTLQIERRTVPGETEDDVRAELETILEQLRAEDPVFDATLETLMVRSPFETTAEAPLVQLLDQTLVELLGAPARHRGEGPWMDSALLAEAGVETVVFGPSGGGAHGHEEWCDLGSVHALATVLAEVARRYCGETVR